MPHLLAVEGPLAGQKFMLQKDVVLGRSFDADIRIDDLAVSRSHAKLSTTADGWVVEDMSSGNGTYLNEALIEGRQLLKNGDLIQVSSSRFRFAAGDKAEPGVTVVEESASVFRPMETLNVRPTTGDVEEPQAEQEPAAVAKANERLRTIVAVSNAVQAQLDMDKLLAEIMNCLFKVFPQMDRGFVMLKAEEGDALVPKVARQRGREDAEAITVSRRIIEETTKNRVAVLSADAMGDNRFSQALSVINFRIRSMMCAPLIANDELMGIIHLDTTQQDKRFTMDDLELLTGVANQTALAVANAKLHQRLLLRQRMERDLQLARQVQESFLPSKVPEVPGMNFASSYKAALEVGGDFYDFIPLGNDRLGIVLGDVAGKGVSAALLMARLTSDVRFSALNEREPRDVLRRVNERLGERNTEGAFVTMIFAVLDIRERRLTLANAAHPPPFLKRSDSADVTELQSCENFPLGAVEKLEFVQQNFQMQSGDMICLYSDGITEAMNASRHVYGSERLKTVLAGAGGNAKDVLNHIMEDVHCFVGDSYQSDDLTVVCFGVK